jgi:hypothetical protein
MKHLNIDSIHKLMDDLNNDHGAKMLRLNEVFIKVYDVLVENNIDVYVFNDMKLIWVTGNHLQYTVSEGNHVFEIHLHLEKTKKVKPHARFVIKNMKSKRVLDEKLPVHDFNDQLPPSFVMMFQNIFPRYYKTLQFKPKVEDDPE